jgi:hypothetical protein
MTTQDKPLEPVRVACEICLKEIPKSEAVVPEASDYVAYFCGLECYEQWRRQSDKAAVQPSPGSHAATARKRR